MDKRTGPDGKEYVKLSLNPTDGDFIEFAEAALDTVKGKKNIDMNQALLWYILAAATMMLAEADDMSEDEIRDIWDSYQLTVMDFMLDVRALSNEHDDGIGPVANEKPV